ncbi:related to GWT1 - GPI-anchored wall transfer protein [Melanopsichium pennsylvanicum]|uniref:GPI-anchored wall transfer protein 1 n=2 Tax=Melanopsichium pennsylvanicum TaxID=63383 RepID=A0AAJ4XL44_9BASI|nr:related to GWT1-GPI-anchored wall transfer protein [Melanopsichium pennsylvanicum 4]SNX84575.1 related to GWT1 - GPI-anchored wall transfer protein [Melanopsichium pennsylvanicum]
MNRPPAAPSQDEPLAAIDAVHRHRTFKPHQPNYAHNSPDHSHLVNAAQSYASISAPSNDATSYKQLKEAWIAGQTGSSIHVVNALALVILATYAIWAVLRAKCLRFVRAQYRRQPHESGNTIFTSIFEATAKLSDWQLEFLILIVPAVGAHTILASQLNTTLGVFVISLLLLIRSGPTTQQKSQHAQEPKKQKRHWSKKYSGYEDDGDEIHTHPTDAQQDALRPCPNLPAAEAELPFRVSIDSAADAAHAAAAPPNFYDGPGSLTSLSRTHAGLSIDTSTSTSPQSPISGASSFADFPFGGSESTLLSPNMASTSAFPASTRRSVEFAALKTNSMPLLHSRDGSDAQSVVSASSAMSPLARSVTNPWANGKQPSSLDHSNSPTDEFSSSSSPHKLAYSTSSASASANGTTQSDPSMFVRPQPFLTVYRAHMMLVTVISILAVDFPVFPRDMSKCESWGTSWMDMGVGSFVFSLGIISALPFLKSPQNRFRPLKQQIVSDFKKSLPLMLLGSVRVILVKGVEYPEHLTEYGVHWNFFITLALLPFAATLSRPFSKYIRYSVLGLGLSIGHQLLLNATRWQEWALSNSIMRDTLPTQNKEGITSMFGYLAIFYIGLDLGHYVLPLDPYLAYRKLSKRRAKPRTDKLAMVLASFAILYWMAFAASYLIGLRTSRRLANLPYVLWVIAFNTSFLLCYVLIYLFILQPVEQEQENATQVDSVTPKILEDLNKHSLIVFLAANLLTGLVNMTTDTMYTSDAVALLIVLVYTGACCGLAHLLTATGIRLKF